MMSKSSKNHAGIMARLASKQKYRCLRLIARDPWAVTATIFGTQARVRGITRRDGRACPKTRAC